MKKNIYNTSRWDAKRKAILKRDGYEDQIMKRYGKHVSAETVHHIVPAEDFPEYRWLEPDKPEQGHSQPHARQGIRHAQR